MLWLLKPVTADPGVWLRRGLAFAALPWLHTKFVILLLAALFLLIRLWPHRKAILAFVAPIALSLVAWLYSFYVMYGVFDPQAPYGDTARTDMLSANIPRGVLGLLFDQKFGLFFYSPIYLVAVAGAWLMLRQPGGGGIDGEWTGM